MENQSEIGGESGEVNVEESAENVETKIESSNIDPDSLEEVERAPEVDLEQFKLKPSTIEKVETVRIRSPFARAEDGKSHRLKVTGQVVHTLERDDGDNIEFRASELIGLEEHKDGSLKGLPSGDDSDWKKFKKTLGIEKPSDAIGKELPMRINVKKSTGQEFLGFMYQ